MTPPIVPNQSVGQGDYAKCEAEIKALTDRVAALEQKVNGDDDSPKSDNPFSAVQSSGGQY